ncbi:AbrB/MazE/SpoVT family DNA-binding domain-containing protein [Rhizobium sp. LjRoot254]|uniref:AbrB/MazE/SpoVT family DNA-binding domain-containing protein n=1 Tax=Rhizobium sp. LjRoot254 TaxID=3342297 RepID=UPI003ECFD54D
MRVTEKGQVTIPKDIRDHFGIKPGSEVEFIASERGALLVKSDATTSSERRERIEDWAKQVEGTFDLDGMTTDEYMIWLRGERDDLDPR